MNLNSSGLTTDDYYMTALRIFEFCGTESTGKLRVDALMEKFAPFVKTNNAEYSHLKSLLDPNEENPEISVSMLANTLQKNSDNQHCKVDFDESFNLKSDQMLGDSDSGISTDAGSQLEELQCSLRSKCHEVSQLRLRLDYCDKQHDDALHALAAERDTLRAHLNLLREENQSLSHVRRDYDEACERLSLSERAMDAAAKELDALRRRNKSLDDQLNVLETEKLSLQELLTASKAECHRINEMYASRQSALLDHNEQLRSQHADLTARLQDHDDFVQQIIKEKVLLEMELKDLLNKSNQTQLRLDRSIDVSYTDEQMLTALDSLNSDARFSQDNRILDEESFINALREDQGRATNMSLFDEIRLSFNISRLNSTDHAIFGKDSTTISTQTEIEPKCTVNKAQNTKHTQTKGSTNISIQTEVEPKFTTNKVQNAIHTQTKDAKTISIQTEFEPKNTVNKGQTTIHTQTEDVNNNTGCLECEKRAKYTKMLERDVDRSRRNIIEMQTEIEQYEDNLSVLEKFVEEGNERNDLMRNIIKSLESKIGLLEVACEKQSAMLDSMMADCVACTQTDGDIMHSVSTQADVPCVDCANNIAARKRGLQRFFWEPLKSLFQVFAVVCFCVALCVLYGVTRSTECARPAVPWRWLHAQELLDLLLRIEYVSDVPM